MRRRAEEPSGCLFNLRMTEDERDRLKQAAAANRQSLSDFARDAIVTAAAETLEDDHNEAAPEAAL